MGNKNKNQNRHNNDKNKEKSMTTETIPTEQINMEALGNKPEAEAKTEEQEDKSVFRTFIIEPVQKVYNSVVAPVIEAGKTFVLDAWQSLKDGFDELKRQYESQGLMRFSLSKLGKGAITLAKVGIVVTVAALLNNYLMANFGFSILSLNAILISLAVAAVAFGIVSYMNQKELTKDFTFKEIGADIAHSMVA